MKVKKIYYSQYWKKLSKKQHTTIRSHKKWKLKEILPEYPEGKYLQDVEIIFKEEDLSIVEIDLEVLLEDTDSECFEEVLQKLNGLREKLAKRYNRDFKPITYDTLFTVYYLRIVNPMRITDFMKPRINKKILSLEKKVKCQKCKKRTLHKINFLETKFDKIWSFEWICKVCKSKN